MLLARCMVVNAWTITVLRVLGIVVLLSGELVLSWILIWLIEGRGVIACGKGVFDNPLWFFDVMVLVGLPLIAICGGGILFLWSSAEKV